MSANFWVKLKNTVVMDLLCSSFSTCGLASYSACIHCNTIYGSCMLHVITPIYIDHAYLYSIKIKAPMGFTVYSTTICVKPDSFPAIATWIDTFINTVVVLRLWKQWFKKINIDLYTCRMAKNLRFDHSEFSVVPNLIILWHLSFVLPIEQVSLSV